MRSRMFSLHETTQRRVCRAAFLVLCVAPTLGTLAWIAWFHRPWRHDDWQRALSQQFHVRAIVEDIQSPRPGVAKIAGVEISALHSERVLATLSELRVENGRTGLAITARRAEVHAGQLQEFVQAAGVSLADSVLPPLELRADELTLVSPQGELLELSNLQLRGKADEAGSMRLQLEAQAMDVGEGEAPAVVRLTIESERNAKTPQLLVAIDARQAKLPTWLVADVAPGIDRCCRATFSGAMQLRHDAEQTTGKLQGRFEDVQFNEWIGPLAPYRMTGMGSVQLDKLEWDASGVTLVEGQIRSGPGAIDRRLLDGLVERVRCLPGAELTGGISTDRKQSFDKLGCGFRVTAAGIEISGLCKTTRGETGCLLTAADRPLLIQPSQAHVPLARLFQVVMPPPTGWLPLSREAIEMATGLPLPSAIPQVANEQSSDRDGTTTR